MRSLPRAGGIASRRLPDVPVWMRMHGEEQAARRRLEHLLDALDRMLERGAIKVEDRPPGHRVWVFGAIGYRVNPVLRGVVVYFRMGGAAVPQPAVVDVFRPLCTSYWLVPVIRFLGLSPWGVQGDLFLDARAVHSLEEWLAEAAWRRIRADARFRWLRDRALPQALGLDPELVSIALASRASARGGLTSAVFNRVWSNEAAYRRVARENPKLLPLVDLAFAGKLLRAGEDPVAGLRRIFTEAGLRPAAWRYVARHGARLFRPAWRIDERQPLRSALRLMQCLQAARLPPRYPPALADVVTAFDEVAGDVLGVVIRAARDAAGTPAWDDFRADVRRVLSWAELEQPALDKRQRRAGWPWLVRQAHAWECRRVLELKGPRSWPSAVGESRHDGYRIVPLDTVDLMVDEALAMRNCLTDCIQYCQLGAERYFSVRDAASGERRAVFQIVLEDRRWRIGQVKGPRNAEVSEAIKALARRIASQYDDLDPGPRETPEPEWLSCLEEETDAPSPA